MEMFKSDMSVPEISSSVTIASTRNNPLRIAFKETTSEVNLESLFNSNLFLNESVLNSFNFGGISAYIEESSNLKNDIDNLIDVFPQLDELVGELDLAARYGEEELEDCESTPDTKIHYPEPFVASPSFVHEEI
jgi:hypothetical protein